MIYCTLCNLHCEILIMVTKTPHVSAVYKGLEQRQFLKNSSNSLLKNQFCFHNSWNSHNLPPLLTAIASDLIFFFPS